MGRRKKEPRSVHRDKIAAAAHQLFMSKGIDTTSVNDIAKEAGYSKATLYVYFQNKEEIIALLVLESMKKLDEYLSAALLSSEDTGKRYALICQALVDYQEQFPFYFSMILDEINIDLEGHSVPQEDKETFRIGEVVNQKLQQFLEDGIRQREIRADIEVLPTIFAFWGMLSGLVQLGENKKEYIKQGFKLTKQEFLNYGFSMLYQSIAAEEDK